MHLLVVFVLYLYDVCLSNNLLRRCVYRTNFCYQKIIILFYCSLSAFFLFFLTGLYISLSSFLLQFLISHFCCSVHGEPLLAVIRVCYNIALNRYLSFLFCLRGLLLSIYNTEVHCLDL